MTHRRGGRRRGRAAVAGAVRRGVLLVAGVVAAAAARPLAAQGAGDGFLFGAPKASLTLRGGFDRALAGSDVFDFVTSNLTVNRGDFSAFTVGGDLALTVAPRVDLVLSGAYSGSTTPSEFRKFTDQDDLPIQQRTSFKRVPVTASVRGYLAPRGRSIGRLAWVPSQYAPYLGAGGGAMWYRLRQEGDFVDSETLDVYPDNLSSSRWTPTAHGFAGIDYSLSPRFALNGEARYTWARADLDGDFVDFDPIDLSGISATVGISVRF